MEHRDYTVGWICALPVEYVAACEFLDEDHPPLHSQSPYDSNAYTLGRIGEHNVVIASPPKGKYGLASVATVAKDMLRSFSSIRFGLIVGIGGGAPSAKHDIRLGDVVVSSPVDRMGGVIYYDFGKAMQEQKFQYIGSLDSPPPALLTALSKVNMQHERQGHSIARSVSEMMARNPRLKRKYERPDVKGDRLYEATYTHADADKDCQTACSPSTPPVVARRDRTEADDDPVVHYGLIASADRPMKDATIRDALAAVEDVMCFEVEAAGLMETYPCLVIRGICDYSDTHKNDRWQGYAAVTAAAYAKELLNNVPWEQARRTRTAAEMTTKGLLDTPLESIEKYFQGRWKASSASLVVLLGVGGCGKSHLALALCQQAERSGEYGHIFWVDATSPNSASQSFTTFAQEIVEHKVDIANEAENIRLVLARLAAAEKLWLLVFDNFDDPSSFSDKHINEYFPRQRQNGSIIVTSRHASTRSLGFSIDLTAMREEEALKLLLQRSKTENTEYNVSEGQRIIKCLGYHALAIDQAGAYILRGVNLDLYMKHYGKSRKKLMQEVPAFAAYKRRGNSGTETELTVFTTWELSFALICGNEKIEEEMRHFINLLAFFNGSDISSELFETYGSTHADWMSSCLAGGGWDKLKFEDILKELKDLSLLQSLEITTSSTRFSVHPLIQDWTKLRIDTEARQAFTVEAVLILGDFLRAHHTRRMTLDTRQSTLSHLDVTLHNCRKYLTEKEYWSPTSLSDSITRIAHFYHDQGRYNAAEETSYRALEGRKLSLGPEHPSTLTSMNDLGEALSNQGKYEEAEKMHRQTLALREKVLGLEHVSTLTSMSNLASVLSNQGKYAEAETIYQRTLALGKITSGTEHLSTLTSMDNLASVLSHEKKYEEAETMYRQTLALRKKELGPEHPSTLVCMNNLASMLSDQGKYIEAETIYRQTLALEKIVSGIEHPSTLTSMGNLASTLSHQGKYTEAEMINRQELTLREKVLGPEHPSTLVCMNNLASMLSDQGKYAEAERIYRQTLALEKTVSGAEHLSTLASMGNLASVLSQQGKYTEAETVNRQELALREKVLSPEHPSTLVCMNNLASMLSDQGKYAEAERIYRRILALEKKVSGAENLSTLMIMGNLASVLSHQGKHAESEIMNLQILALREKVLGPEHPSTLMSMNEVALSLSKQGRFPEAETMHRQTLALKERVLGPGHPSTITSINNLALALSDQGKNVEAEKMYRQALVLKGSRKRLKEGTGFDFYLDAEAQIPVREYSDTHHIDNPHGGSGKPSFRVTENPRSYASSKAPWPEGEQLHSSFQKVENSKKFFIPGRIFATLWPEPAGPSTKDTRNLTRGPFGQMIFTKIERFVVIRNTPTHCLCSPIHTYGGRADQKYSSKPQDQYSVFAAGDSWDESRLWKKELPVVVEDEQVDIKYPDARVDCSKIYTIEHYSIVRKIGRIDKKGLPLLEECFRLAMNVPLEVAEIESHSQRQIMMHSPQNMKWHALIAILDTGMKENCISKNVVDRLGLRRFAVAGKRKTFLRHEESFSDSTVSCTWRFQHSTRSDQSEFWVFHNTPFDVLLGCDVIEAAGILTAQERLLASDGPPTLSRTADLATNGLSQRGECDFYAPPPSGSRRDTDISAPNSLGHYSNTALRPVANYVPRPYLHRQIEEQLHHARQTANDTHMLVIQGLGGSGKSQLALNYVRERREDYSAIFWIEAGRKESIERDYLQIHRLLFNSIPVTTQEELEIEEAVAAVKSWFYSQKERSLVVLDGVGTIDEGDDGSYIDLSFFLPDAPTVDIIITTRNTRVAELTTLKTVEVGEMETVEASQLFRKCAKQNSAESVLDMEVLMIVEELGRLALAIAMAGSYVAATPRLWSDIRLFLPEYRERSKQMLAAKAKKPIHRYGESVFSTWEISFAAIARKSSVAPRLFSLLAFLNFDDIFPELFERLMRRREPATDKNNASDQEWQSYLSPDGSADQYAVEAAFGVLRTYSLIQWREGWGGYAMHKLVHTWAHDRLEVEQQRHLAVVALQMLIEALSAFHTEAMYKIRIAPHLMANFGTISVVYNSPGLGDTTVLGLIAKTGKLLLSVGRWSDLYTVQRFHSTKTAELYGFEHFNTLTSMNNLADVLSCQGKYEQAEEMHRRILGLRETALGKEHPDTLTSMNNLADVLGRQGKYKQAEEIHRRTVWLRAAVLGKEHPDTLTSINNLAQVLSRQGKYDQAEEMHRQTLKLRETVLGEEHSDTLMSMNNLADVLGRQGKYEQAEGMHRHTLRLRETVLGGEHPDALTSLNNLACVLSRQGKYEQAEGMHRHTSRLRETVLGKEHPDTLTSMDNLAQVLSRQGKYEQAEGMHRHTLRLRETVLGEEHPDTLTSINNLAQELGRQGKYEQAEEMHRHTLRLRETVLGEEHPDTLTSMNNLAQVLTCQCKYEEAEKIYWRALGLKETVLGKEHPSTLASVYCLAYLLHLQQRVVEADLLYQRVLAGYEKTLGSNHPTSQACWKHYLSMVKNRGNLDTKMGR